MNEYIEFHRENTDPRIINENEKDEYTKFHDSLKSEEVKTKPVMSFEDMSWGKTIVTGLSNLPSDILPFYKDYITGIYEVIRHPMITSKALGRIGIGMLAEEVIDNPKITRYLPPEQAKSLYYYGQNIDKYKTADDKNSQMWLAVEDELYANFGTEANFKRYIAENPAEAIFTLAEILIPVAKAGKIKTLERIASSVDPITLTGEGFKLAKNIAISKDIPKALHRKSLRLLRQEFGEKKVANMLDAAEGLKLNITDKKLNRLDESINLLGKTKDEVENAVSANLRIPVEDIFNNLDEFEKVMLETSSEGIEVKKIIKNIKQNILEANNELGRTQLTVNELRKYKERFNKELNKFYKDAAATTEALPLRKEIKGEIDRAMREYLEIIIPDAKIKGMGITKRYIKKRYGVDVTYKQLNEMQGALIELRTVMTDMSDKLAVGPIMDFMVGQKASTLGRIGGIAGAAVTGGLSGDFVSGGIGYIAGRALGTTTGFAIGLIDSSPKIKMAIANFVNTLKVVGIPISPSATLVRMGLFEAGDIQRRYPIPEGESTGKFTITK